MKNILTLCVLLVGLMVACDDADNGDQVNATDSQKVTYTGDPLAAAGQVGMLDTKAERQRRINYINNLNSRMIVDDWDSFWLYERSNTLTPYIARTGR